MSRRHVIPALLCLPAMLLVGCAGDEQEATPAAGQAVSCSYPKSDSPAKPVDPPQTDSVLSSGQAKVSMTIDGEPVELTLDRSAAPCTVNSFESLAKQGWYSNTKCHRLTDQGIFVLQCGDPSGTGRGGPGYTFADELSSAKKLADAGGGAVIYPKGTLAMANAGPNTNGSQVFMVWQDSPLPPDYTVFGSMDEKSVTTIGKIAAEGVAADGTAPNAPALIGEVTLG